MTYWDGYRWRQEPPRTPPPRDHRSRDLLATLLMIVGLIAVALPMVRSEAAESRLSLSPSTAVVGSRVGVTGAKFPAGATVQLLFDGSASGLPRVTVPASGTINASFVVPSVSPGSHSVTIRTVTRAGRISKAGGGSGQASAQLWVADAGPLVAAPTATLIETPSPTTLAISVTSPTPSPPTATPQPPTPTVSATPVAVPTLVPPAPAGAAPPIPAGGTVLFDASTGTLGKLRPETYPNDHPGDGMIRCGLFTSDPAYYPISGGALRLRTALVNGSWVQTFLTTRTTFTQQYGIFRAALQWDNGYQLWPAFWLYDPKWSAAEIDVVENHPNPDSPNDWGFYLHPGTYNKSLVAPSDHVTTWHVYELEWRATFVAVRIDGVEKHRYTSGSPSIPLWVGFDMKLGTPWENKCPDETTPSRAELRVAWLQVTP